jgi:hypothetical protein
MDNLEEYERRLAELEAQMAQVSELMAGWPTPATLLQGFLAGRFQRRDGHGYQQPLENIPEAPSDGYYYGRHNFAWAQVVEEAPELTSRRSATGWARASFGSDTPWISLDDVLINYVPEVPVGQGMYARARSGGETGWTDLAGVFAPPGDYLDKAGGQMSGPLITRDGGSATNPGLAIGENSTGFYRTAGNLLVTTVSGIIVTQIQAAIAAFFVQVNFTGKALAAVGDPVLGDDALNLRTADGRYAPVGSVRARPVVYDVAADILIPASGAWTLIATVPITLPARPGVASLLMVSVNCNLSGVNNVAGIGARIPISPTPEQRIFGFGGTATDPSAGFSVNFFVTSGPGANTFSIPVQLNAFPITGGSPVPYTVVGGNVLVIDRSQVVVIDLGPA